MQSCQNWKLLVRDDSSKDETLPILQKFANKVKKVEIIPDNINIGAKASFARLVEAALENDSWDYLMFADQDDIWMKNKIEKTLLKMKNSHEGIPLLVHSDVSVADSNLQIIHRSLWEYQNIDPNKDTFNNFLLKNAVTGCTIMMNRQLAQMILPIPNEAIMHDWWIAMVASAFGKIAYIDEPLMLYRQHGTNDTGAKNYGWGYFIKKFIERPSLDRYLAQAEIFLCMYEDKLDDNSKEMLLVLKDFNSFSKFKKIKVIIRYKLWKNGFIRNIGLLVNA